MQVNFSVRPFQWSILQAMLFAFFGAAQRRRDSGDIARGGYTSSCQSLSLWWTGRVRERERCTRRTTLHGDRRHSWGRGRRFCLRLPQGSTVARCPVGGGPTHAMLVLGSRAAELVDSSSLPFLTASALEATRKDEEEEKKKKKPKFQADIDAAL